MTVIVITSHKNDGAIKFHQLGVIVWTPFPTNLKLSIQHSLRFFYLVISPFHSNLKHNQEAESHNPQHHASSIIDHLIIHGRVLTRSVRSTILSTPSNKASPSRLKIYLQHFCRLLNINPFCVLHMWKRTKVVDH